MGLILLFILFVAAALGVGAKYNFTAELSTHFTVYFAVMSVLLCVMLLLHLAERWKIAMAVVIAAYFSFKVIWLLIPPHPQRSDNFEDITVLQFNAYFMEPVMGGFHAWVRAQQPQPDIVVLQEINPAMVRALKAFEADYPYRIIDPSADSFGMAIFSKLPMERFQRDLFVADQWNKYTQAYLRTARLSLPFTLTELHASPPTDANNATERNHQLKQVAPVINQQPAYYKVVVGNLNVTPFSPWFSGLTRETGLTSAMQGRSLAGSWPGYWPAFLRMPIEHLLVSDNIEVMKREVVAGRYSDVPSDYVPILYTLRFYDAPLAEPAAP